MPRKKETITLSIPPGTKEHLEVIARRNNILWGKQPSVSGLIVAIAQQQFEIGQPFTLNSNQVKALQQAIRDLIDAGEIEDARTIIALLIERGNLEATLRQSLLQQVSQPIRGLRREIEELRTKQQPFYLLYSNSQGQELEYTVRYAEIRFYEKRFYLLIWCEETADVENDIPDLPQLWHNRCLDFDLIRSILPISGDWRGKLDSIEVHLQIREKMASFDQLKDDPTDEKLNFDVPNVVVRRVINPFWLIKEVQGLGKNCLILAPDSMRDRFLRELVNICNLYGIETKSS